MFSAHHNYTLVRPYTKSSNKTPSTLTASFNKKILIGLLSAKFLPRWKKRKFIIQASSSLTERSPEEWVVLWAWRLPTHLGPQLNLSISKRKASELSSKAFMTFMLLSWLINFDQDQEKLEFGLTMLRWASVWLTLSSWLTISFTLDISDTCLLSGLSMV